MPSIRAQRSRYSSRPFIASTLLITLFATYALLLRPRLQHIQHHYQHQYGAQLKSREAREADVECRAVHHAADKCAFILANCEDDEAGLIHYLTFYYCTLGNAQPVAFVILASWLGLLFTTIGIAASDFFSVNLSTIASVLGLSESLAGVTFLAFGNGSPDVFSTFAAMGSNSGSMAVGELLGAAGFITAVVAGSMALVREFKVSKRTFVRDIVFFIIAISFAMVFLADGELHLWECCVMIGFYLFYVVVVVGWHWFTVRRRQRRMRETASRTHVYGPSPEATDELEPYQDEPDEDEAAPVGRSRSSTGAVDISALERGPRIEVDGRRIEPTVPEEDEEEDQNIHVAAEMTSSMRVNRPRYGRSNTTITPIRPSLVGALEFRHVLSSLQKERNVQMGPLHRRGQSYHQITQSAQPFEQANLSFEHPRGRVQSIIAQTAPARDRALSSGDFPMNLENEGLPRFEIGPEAPDDPKLGAVHEPETRASSTARTVDGRLAPPTSIPLIKDHASHQPSGEGRNQHLHIQIPTTSSVGSSAHTSPISPFPAFLESPGVMTPALQHNGGHQPSSASFPFPSHISERRHSSAVPDDFGAFEEDPKPVRWWPYRFLPPPHVLFSTIFPTLQGWRGKSIWDKLLSLVSVPSIFILVTTLPVVETENVEDEEDSEIVIADSPSVGQLGHTAVPVLREEVERGIEPETEWQEYRRRTRSMVSARSPISLSASAASLRPAAFPPYRDNDSVSERTGRPSTTTSGGVRETVPPQDQQRQRTVKPSSNTSGSNGGGLEPDSVTATSAAGEQQQLGWNRWLVALQLFTGPQFVAFIIWANTWDDMESPRKTLVRWVLYALVFSLCLLGVLLSTTTPDKKPKYHFMLCFLGFVISVAWISTVAGEVVGVLKAFGVILGISEAILGLTIFAVGNSLGDLVADVTVARLGYPVMALWVPLFLFPCFPEPQSDDVQIEPTKRGQRLLTKPV